MARNTDDQKKVTTTDRNNKARNGDTNRTSSQGRKVASGGRAQTNNQGQPKGPKTS